MNTIEQIDAKLSNLGNQYFAAKKETQRKLIMHGINELLDKRLSLTK